MEVFIMWSKILNFAAKKGTRAVKWVWKHKWELLSLGSMVWDYIKRHV